MKIRSVLLSCLVSMLGACALQAQMLQISSIEAPYPAVQSSVQYGGKTFGPGVVAYGPEGTPLVIHGAGFGSGGTVYFHGGVAGVVTIWTSTEIFLKVPSNAITGFVTVVTGGMVSDGLPFMVTRGQYSGSSCPTYPPQSQLEITTNSLPNGIVGQAYSTTLNATGGTPPYSWSSIGNPIPSGLSLSSGGVLSGTPNTASTSTDLTIEVVDKNSQVSSIILDMGVDGPTGSQTGVYSYSAGYDNAGNVISYSDSVMGNWTFTYDAVNRLESAVPGSGAPAQYSGQSLCMAYDAFGNRTAQNQQSSACPASESSVSPAATFTSANQLSGGNLGYDGSGNINSDLGHMYLYDAEGRLCAVNNNAVPGTTVMTGYIYNAEGQRIAKGTITSMSCNPATNGFQLTENYLLGANGEQLTTLDGSNNPERTNVFGNGALIATYDPNGLHFHLTDPLGTRRAQTDWLGQAELNCQSLPFGDGLTCYQPSNAPATADDATPLHFTGKERDSESGNDYFGARYYASTMGRFLSPDPQGNSYADFSNPQTWNMYAYVLNNPLKFTDPTGMYCYYGDTDFSSEQGQKDQNDATQWDYHSNSGECGKNGGQWYDDAYTHGGFDDAGRPDYAVSTNTQASNSPQPSADDAWQDLKTTIPGLQDNVVNWAFSTFFPATLGGTRNSFAGQDPYRLFGTHHCGPGGAGATVGALDPACKVHDACYAAAPDGGVSPGNNVNPRSPMTAGQAAQAKQCNQALYDAARNHPDAPGSKAVQWWMVNGSHLPGGAYILFPGTEAKPW